MNLIGSPAVNYLQVNTPSEWIIGLYLHEFTNNKLEIPIAHEFIVTDKSR